MPADIVKAAQDAIAAAHEQQWFAHQFRRKVIARMTNLAGVPYHLPGAGEDFFFFGGEDFRIGVERCGKRPRAGDVGFNTKPVFRDFHGLVVIFDGTFYAANFVDHKGHELARRKTTTLFVYLSTPTDYWVSAGCQP